MYRKSSAFCAFYRKTDYDMSIWLQSCILLYCIVLYRIVLSVLRCPLPAVHSQRSESHAASLHTQTLGAGVHVTSNVTCCSACQSLSSSADMPNYETIKFGS